MTVNPSSKTEPRPDSPLPIKDIQTVLPSQRRWEYRVQEGFWLSLLDIERRKPLRLEYEKDSPTLNFGFVLAGSYTHRINAPGLCRHEFSSHAGASGILYLPRQRGVLHIPGQTRVRVFHIHLSAAVFYELFHPEAATLPKGLRSILDGLPDRSYAFRTGIPMENRAALKRLINGPCPGTPARLFYQAIALDLVAGQICRANTRLFFAGGPPLGELDRVTWARDLLVRDLASPPCLRQLSRQIGLNMNKLQQGFYRLYGVSVFKYLHQYRMQEANRLFHETDMNVSQAAAAVGYTNVSHFSRAFKKQFNILPKKHLIAIKK